MDNAEINEQFAYMRQQMELQQGLLAALQQQQGQRENARDSDQKLELFPQITACIPPHLQLAPCEPAERKRIIKRYPEPILPRVIKDTNGLAAHAIGADATTKKFVTEGSPALQREFLDVVRVAACSWQHACALREADPAGAAEVLVNGMRDINTISCESAQRAAQLQLKQTLSAAGQQSAYAMLDLRANTEQLDFENTNVLQQAHLDVFADLKDFRGAIESTRPKKATTSNHSNFGQGRGSGNDRGRGRGKGGRGHKGGKGGKGGKGFSNNQPAAPNGGLGP